MGFRSPGLCIAAGLVSLGFVALQSQSALAAPVATGDLAAIGDLVNLTFTSEATFDDVTFDVFGTPVNFGTAVGSMHGSGQIFNFNGLSRCAPPPPEGGGFASG